MVKDRPHQTNEPIAEALGPLLRAHQRLPMGRVSFERFAREVGGWDPSVLRRMVNRKVTLQPDAIEAMARVLDVEPEYFLEYRVWQIGKVLERHPDAEELLYDIAMDVAEDRDGARPRAGKGE